MRRMCMFFFWFYIVVSLTPQSGIAQRGGSDIGDISLDSLLNVQVSAAAKYEQKISEAPASVTIITAEDIERYGYRSLEEVFMSVRGFYVSNDRNYAYLGVRGFSRPTDYNDRILLLINGHTTNENVYGSAFIGTELGMNQDIIERIEIVRGPGSALYGTNAMFAVINIITKKGNTIDGFELSAEKGSYGKLEGTAIFGKEFDNGMKVSISGMWADIKGQNLFYEEFERFSTNYGIAENLDWDKYHGFLTIISYNYFTLQGLITSREKGIPTAAWEMAFNEDDAKSLDERKFIELKYDREIGADKSIMLRGYFDHYGFKGTYPYEDIDWFDASDGNWLGGEFQFLWDLQVNNRLTIGGEYQNHLRADYRNWDEDMTYFDDNFPFNVFSFYIQDEYQVAKNLSFTFGVRQDEYSTVRSSTTPRGAIVYNPMKSSTLKLIYGEAFRAPNIYEVHYEDPDFAKNNPDLKPEKIRTMEVIWEQRLSKELFGIVSLYNYEIKDLIDPIIDPSDDLSQFQNISKAKASGVELELDARLKRGISGYVNYAFQNAEEPDLKEKLTNSPSHIFKVGLACPVMRHFYMAGQLMYETERITVYGTKTEPYLLTNFNLSTKPLFNHIKASFLVRNLFDAKYKTPGGYEHIQDAITQNGRNFALKLEYKF